MMMEGILTFSETLVVLPFNNSGAIHGRVPLTPPETRVLRLILDSPKSPTCNKGSKHDCCITSHCFNKILYIV